MRVGFDALSRFSWAATEAGVGAEPEATCTRTTLFLSLNVTFPAEPIWVQPSGYVIE